MADPTDPAASAASIGAGFGLSGAEIMQALTQGGGGYSSNDRAVYWGETPLPEGTAGVKTRGGVIPIPSSRSRTSPLLVTSQPDIRTESDVNAWLSRMMVTDPETWTKIKQQLVQAGLISANDPPNQVLSAWGWVVGQAADLFNSSDHTQMSPLELLDHLAGAGAENGLGGPTTNTYTTTSISTPGEVAANYRQVAQPLIGKMPSGTGPVSEVQAAQRANPQRSTVTTDKEGNQTRTDTGGLSAAEVEQILRNRAMQEPSYGSYQAATTYFDVLRGLLGPAV